jgi:hypothetical protein
MMSTKSNILALSLAFLFTVLALRADSLLQPNDRVAMLGGGYELYFEDYLLACETTPGLDFAEFQWLGGDPAVVLAQLNNAVLPYKPTVAVTYFGGDPSTFEKNQTAVIEALKKAGVRTIVIGTPLCVYPTDYPNDPARAAAEDKSRAALAQIAQDVATKENVIYADVYGQTKATRARIQAAHAENCVPGTAMDESRSLDVTGAFLKALGCDGSIGTVTVDYSAGQVEGSPGQKALGFQNHNAQVESTRFPFWFPGHGVGATDRPWPILKYLTFDQDLNRYMLVVKNLPTAQAKIYWTADQQQDFSSEDLSKGVNLEPEFRRDVGGVFNGVDNGVRGQQGQEDQSGTALLQGKPDPQADAKREAALQAARKRAVPSQTVIGIWPLLPIEKRPPGPIPVIIDTDLGSDVDDVGALALLDDFTDQGQAKLIACVHNVMDARLATCGTIQAINAYYGHPDIPIGQYYGEPGPTPHMTSVLAPAPAGPGAYHGPAAVFGSGYTLQVHQKFNPSFPNDDKMPAGVDVYRKALASAADHTVTIASVGFMGNLQDLLLSQPDSVSPLNGIDLVRKKVLELDIMSNTLPSDLYVLTNWPTKIMWTCDVGSNIGTGPSLIPTPENNPVRMAYGLFGDGHTSALTNGRQSWDLTAAWLAVRGAGDFWDVLAGRPQYISDITHDPARDHPKESVVTFRMPPDQVSKIIGEELARPPKY